jgi:hypothetical protein
LGAEALEAGLKTGGLTVEVVEDTVVLLCATGRSSDCEGIGAEVESRAGPSKGDGEGHDLAVALRKSSSSSSSGAGVALADTGVDSLFLLS